MQRKSEHISVYIPTEEGKFLDWLSTYGFNGNRSHAIKWCIRKAMPKAKFLDFMKKYHCSLMNHYAELENQAMKEDLTEKAIQSFENDKFYKDIGQ